MLPADRIAGPLAATSKKQAFEQLARHAGELFHAAPDMVLAGLLDRERLGCTGIGLGCAIPHLKISGLKRPYGILLRLAAPVDYGAPDGAPVDLLYLLVVPDSGRTTAHMKSLALMARFLRDPAIRQNLRAADASAMAAVIDEWVRRQQAA
jgi:nitrogen PTS system EIIA component